MFYLLIGMSIGIICLLVALAFARAAARGNVYHEHLLHDAAYDDDPPVEDHLNAYLSTLQRPMVTPNKEPRSERVVR